MQRKEQLKCLAERHVANDVSTSTVDLSTFPIPVAKFISKEIEKRCLEKDEIDQYWIVSDKVAVGHTTKTVD